MIQKKEKIFHYISVTLFTFVSESCIIFVTEKNRKDLKYFCSQRPLRE